MFFAFTEHIEQPALKTTVTLINNSPVYSLYVSGVGVDLWSRQWMGGGRRGTHADLIWWGTRPRRSGGPGCSTWRSRSRAAPSTSASCPAHPSTRKPWTQPSAHTQPTSGLCVCLFCVCVRVCGRVCVL